MVLSTVGISTESSIVSQSLKCFGCKVSATRSLNHARIKNLIWMPAIQRRHSAASHLQCRPITMTVLEVDKKLLKELEGFGFPRARAARALHYSGNASLEDAIKWIVDHENDAENDEMPLIAVNIEIESPQMEEVEKREQEKGSPPRPRIQDLTYWRKEEKKLERREKVQQRIHAGRKLLEAALTAAENERRRFLAAREAKREEVNRAREEIRQKIAADMVERRWQLGFPSENRVTLNPSKPIVQDKKPFLPVMTITKAEKMRECLRSLRRNHKDDDARVKRAFQTLLIYVGNIVKNPNEEKYRKIRLGNPLFQDRVGSMEGGIEFLELCGFEKTEGGDFLHLPSDNLDMAGLNAAGSLLRSAMSNPFFGLLGG